MGRWVARPPSGKAGDRGSKAEGLDTSKSHGSPTRSTHPPTNSSYSPCRSFTITAAACRHANLVMVASTLLSVSSHTFAAPRLASQSHHYLSGYQHTQPLASCPTLHFRRPFSTTRATQPLRSLSTSNAYWRCHARDTTASPRSTLLSPLHSRPDLITRSYRSLAEQEDPHSTASQSASRGGKPDPATLRTKQEPGAAAATATVTTSPTSSPAPKTPAAKKTDSGEDPLNLSTLDNKTVKQQRETDWRIVKRLIGHVWPKDERGAKIRVVLALGLLIGGKVSRRRSDTTRRISCGIPDQ